MSIDERRLYKLVGSRIREQRTLRGCTQDELAQATGLLRTSITNIEAGRQRPPLHVLYTLCNALGTEMTTILPRTAELDVTPSPKNSEFPKAAALLKQLLGEGEEAATYSS